MSDPLRKYDFCSVCGKEHSDANLKALALRRFEQLACSPECREADTKRRYACCDKAVQIPCVCSYAFRCPEHGERHVGTHD